MSRAEKLFEAIGLVDDAYIEEAADARAVRTPSQWQRWGALAAMLVLVAGLGLTATTQLRGCGAKTADSAAPENGAMQESTTTDSAFDSATTGSATGSSGGAMEESAATGNSALDGGAVNGFDVGTPMLPTDGVGTELAVLMVSDGVWTVDRHTAVDVAEQVTVTDTYLLTNDGNADQEIAAQIVAPGETVALDAVTTSAGTELVLLPVENVTPGVWTVEITAADGYAVEGLTEGELTWEAHAFTVSQP